MKIDEYVPEMIPIRRARMNGRIDGAAEQEERREREDHDEARVDRPAERLQDRVVDDRGERLAGMAGAVLADPVVDDDRVVDREADDRQHRGDEEAVDLEPEERAEDGERADDHDDVVEQRHEGGRPEPEVAEAERHPEQDPDRAEDDEEDRLLGQLGRR